MSRKLATIGLLLVGLVACSDADPAGPAMIRDDYELPPADASLDPARLSVGHYIATPCAFRWPGGNGAEGLRDRHEWETVDIYFGSAQGDGPTQEEVRFVEAHGGRVLHRFNVRAVRARIQLSSIPELVRTGDWVTVRDVPDPTRYDISGLSVGFDRDMREDDVERYVQLGGRVNYRWSWGAISGDLPDASVPKLRALLGVKYVEVSGVVCLA